MNEGRLCFALGYPTRMFEWHKNAGTGVNEVQTLAQSRGGPQTEDYCGLEECPTEVKVSV